MIDRNEEKKERNRRKLKVGRTLAPEEIEELIAESLDNTL